MRYFFEISYDGTNYHGWQKQPNSKTIQETIETCFSTILKQKIDIVGAGRTDAGVHAKEQSAHFMVCLLYTSPSPRDRTRSRMPSSA